MSNNYNKLISLALESDKASTPEKINLLNDLLVNLEIGEIKLEHQGLLDDLITILFNTDNIFTKKPFENI